MSYETLAIMRRMDFNGFESKVAFQCAPVFAHLKASNLLIIEPEDCGRIEDKLKDSVFSCYKLFVDEQAYYLVYEEKALSECLNHEDIQVFLKKVGYEDLELAAVLKHFALRFEMAKKQNEDFPHEMGFLLDYPSADVFSFIENKGANAKYIGYWKVYHNVDEAKHKFSLFSIAEELAVGLVFKKQSVLELGEMFRAY